MQGSLNSNIEARFGRLRSRHEGALIAYLTGGDPSPKPFQRNLRTLAEAGADMIEIGIPFSDPIADGPTIQSSSQRALSAGTTPREVMKQARRFSDSYPDVPLVFLTYYNPVLAMGLTSFMKRAHDSGVSGIVVPDLPVEESSEYRAAASKNSVDTIFLTAPNTSDSRLARIVKNSSGFVYLVSLYGVTGSRSELSESALSSVKRVKNISSDFPAAAGFGISRPDHVARLIQSGADGAIVGSALVKIVADHLSDPDQATEELTRKTRALKRATILRA